MNGERPTACMELLSYIDTDNTGDNTILTISLHYNTSTFMLLLAVDFTTNPVAPCPEGILSMVARSGLW